jgi:hypothetical protein
MQKKWSSNMSSNVCGDVKMQAGKAQQPDTQHDGGSHLQETCQIRPRVLAGHTMHNTHNRNVV